MDTFFVRGSKLTLFSWAGRKLFVFCVSYETDLVFVMVEINFISVWVMELDLLSV